MREQTCCFTGHRHIPEADREKIKHRLETVITSLYQRGVCYYGAGGALGFDTLAAQAVLRLREQYPALKLILVLPCLDQTKGWRQEDIAVYDQIKAGADKVVYTGMLDDYFGHCFGTLEYRSLRFETEELDMENYQGNAVVNFTDRETPYTRVIEHKHFEFGNQEKTVVTREYPADWQPGDEPYYPMNDETNNTLFEKYQNLAKKEKNVIFGGRLGQYKYYDMDDVIEQALLCAEREHS